MFGEYEITFDWTKSCWVDGDIKRYQKPYIQHFKLPPLPLTHLRYEDTIEYIPDELIDEYESSSDESEYEY